MAEVFSLRVRRSRAQRAFPFDRVYLVAYEDRAIIKRHWRYCLVLPVMNELEKMLKTAVPEEWLYRPHERDDAASQKEVGTKERWEQFVDSRDWICVVPILTRMFKEQIEAHPRYLIAQNWHTAQFKEKERAEKNKSTFKPYDAFPDMSYLQTPEKPIRPICSACPRFISHMAGECEIGQKVCFENLPLGGDYFKEGLDLADSVPSVLDEDYAKILGGDV